ncbi:acyl-CoA dehydrogenase family protein [Nakamurella lactea]|uniref:acyl-CoA dehydrogenase family protein n=1 Tax=Nakamurella lactea TaxID=459515 RepID=UPI0004267E77|nr:acyl-CoA dehydrogenase family protein [Nakamurella lactea]
MDNRIPDDARDFEQAATSRFAAAGAVGLARRAQYRPDVRSEALAALDDLGVDELDVRADGEQLIAGALLCRAAGSVMLPAPVAPRLLAIGSRWSALVDPRHPMVDHGDLGPGWAGLDLSGRRWQLQPGERVTKRLAPFLREATLSEPEQAADPKDLARQLLLESWSILGAATAAFEHTRTHVLEREQFGHPLAGFQTVRFTVADGYVRLRGLEESAKYATWRLPSVAVAQARADAIGVRLHAVDVAISTLRVAHQLHGAVGFCDETDVSILDTHLQPLLRLPAGVDALARELAPAIGDGSFTGLDGTSTHAR